MSYSRPYAASGNGSRVPQPYRGGLAKHLEALDLDHRERLAVIDGHLETGTRAIDQMTQLTDHAHEAIEQEVVSMVRRLTASQRVPLEQGALEKITLQQIEELGAHIRSVVNAAGWRMVEEVNRPYDTTPIPESAFAGVRKLIKELG